MYQVAVYGPEGEVRQVGSGYTEVQAITEARRHLPDGIRWHAAVIGESGRARMYLMKVAGVVYCVDAWRVAHPGRALREMREALRAAG